MLDDDYRKHEGDDYLGMYNTPAKRRRLRKVLVVITTILVLVTAGVLFSK